MTYLFEALYHAWCVPYDPEDCPEALRGDPVQAYGLYAFEEGFRLAVQLMTACLDPRKLDEIR